MCAWNCKERRLGGRKVLEASFYKDVACLIAIDFCITKKKRHSDVVIFFMGSFDICRIIRIGRMRFANMSSIRIHVLKKKSIISY